MTKEYTKVKKLKFSLKIDKLNNLQKNIITCMTSKYSSMTNI